LALCSKGANGMGGHPGKNYVCTVPSSQSWDSIVCRRGTCTDILLLMTVIHFRDNHPSDEPVQVFMVSMIMIPLHPERVLFVILTPLRFSVT
jgi:hypothetical protein